MPKPSLPVRLALLVAATDYFAAGIVFHNYEQDRQDASQRVLQTVRSVRLVLDAEIQRMTGGLKVLALTTALREGDFGNFRRIDSGTVALDWEVITENAKPKFENDMVGGRRPSRRRPGAARFRIELIERSARDQLDGEATVDFLPRGVVYTVICSLEDKS